MARGVIVGTRDAERAEVATWGGTWDVVPPKVAREVGAQLFRVHGAAAMMLEKVPTWFFNRVVGLGVEQPVNEGELDELIALYRDRRLPVAISLCPDAEPSALGGWLVDRGFREENRWVRWFAVLSHLERFAPTSASSARRRRTSPPCVI